MSTQDENWVLHLELGSSSHDRVRDWPQVISNESCVFVLLSCDKVPAWNYGNEAPRAGVLSAMSLNYVEDKFIGKLLFSRNPPMWIPPRAPPNIIRSTHGLLAEAGEILGQPGSPVLLPCLPPTHSPK